jgi:two-component system chemotaxis sensor kinase CheA
VTVDRSQREFLGEATEIVEALQAGFVRVADDQSRGTQSPALLNEVFRHAHSLKGLAGMFGVEPMGRLAHEMEALLDGLRLGRLLIDDELMLLLYGCADTFAVLLHALSRDESPDLAAIDTMVARIKRKVESSAAAAGSSDPSDLGLSSEVLSSLTEYEEHRLRDSAARGVPIFRVHAPLPFTSFEQSLTALTAAVQALGELISTLPSTDPSGDALVFDLLVASSRNAEEILAATSAHGATSVDRLDARRSSPPPVTAAAAMTMMHEEEHPPATMRQTVDTVRVDIKKLDELMGIVGELVLARGGLNRVTGELKAEMGYRGLAVDLHRLVRTVERRIVDLQLAIMQVRMVPLGQVFDRLARAVRRISHTVGKEVELHVVGEDTELDKLIVEDLVDPLMHLVRNALDHGLESPEARVAAGKSRKGRLELRAFPRGNQVVIEVADDGRGIDEVAVKRTALERGVVTEENVGQMGRREIWNLIFQPGFSTRREVTDLSGRGVGLDVVKTNIARLSGLVDVDSTAGRGTKFTITLPMTLAIIQAVITRSAGRIYALPLASVLEMVTVYRRDLCTVEGREMMTLRGQTLPLLRLDRVFHPEEAVRRTEEEVGYAAVVGLVQHRAALLVDDVLGQQDVVIKGLGAYLSNVKGIAGATHLGDHETILVLDIAALIQELIDSDGAASLIPRSAGP